MSRENRFTQLLQKLVKRYPATGSYLSDRFGRVVNYLRVSVTDRCNLRCVYCMPPDGIRLFERDRILTFEEMVRFSRVAVGLGVRRIKVTGGEPLVRRGVVDFIASLRGIDGLEDLSITTNGVFLSGLAGELKRSGLDGVNVSLDSLDPERYRVITRGGDLGKVIEGIDKALGEGLRVKINTVILSGLSDSEVFRLIEFGRVRGIEVRFIEFMPLCGGGWRRDAFIPLLDIRRRIEERYRLFPLKSEGVASRYGIEGGGVIGFITPVSEPFCSGCSRLRLTARGTLRPCLFSSLEVDIFGLLRGGASDGEIGEAIRRVVYMKPRWNPVLSGVEDPKKVFIRNIGG